MGRGCGAALCGELTSSTSRSLSKTGSNVSLPRLKNLRLHRCGMRYAERRTLKTKRGVLKATLNAWCLSCHKPMARHGKNFSCAFCHLATRIHSVGCRKRAEAIREGRKASRCLQSQYPFCLPCKIRMHRVSRNSSSRPHGFRCRQCRQITASRIEYSKAYWREKEILELIRAGHLDSQIVRKMKCHHQTVKRLRSQVSDERRCECGQLFFHVDQCSRRPGWQTKARERRDTFEELLVRINRRIPSAFPDEMRDEICQEMFLEIIKSVDRVLANAPEFIRKYKQRYPFQYHSFDANPKLVERIAG